MKNVKKVVLRKTNTDALRETKIDASRTTRWKARRLSKKEGKRSEMMIQKTEQIKARCEERI